ncbi:Methyltransferase domain-containing protein [Caballeronia arationis]|uniref:Methyltransferase domain-containing protein n=1 Tax=Caballeronia arationis TaxID=1777142 RepID=A0A7Z7IA28_9BURK|nr:class I SAM-dependent methyltransferase [Caballeronia arationis]SOE82109.1 Methyltransferase domain-containing protein [Caballeronia arationis]
MSNVQFNSQYWDGLYDWQGAGEEWSWLWGGSRAQWLGSLYPRISGFLPAKSVLEIAPGFGRWTQFLLSACDKYQGVDLSQECVDACVARFSQISKGAFFKNDGTSLDCAESGSIDFLFSFDSLVHATSEVIAAYVPEILRVLTPSGVAFIHHSNWKESGDGLSNEHGRASDVAADDVVKMISNAGGKVIIQEKINWGYDAQCIDCLTLFGWKGPDEPVVMENHDFMLEGHNIRKYQSPYSKLTSASN